MATPFALSPAQMDEAVELYERHEWPVADIAEHFEVSKTATTNALLHKGVALRASRPPAEQLRIKQCAACLHFLPVGLFSWCGPSDNRRLQSWCKPCTNHPKPEPWATNSAPLARAITSWSHQ